MRTLRTKRGVNLVDEDEFEGDPYSSSLAREYAKEDALRKEKKELEEAAAKRRAEEAKKQKAKEAYEEAIKHKVIPPPYVPKLPYPGRFKKQTQEKVKAIFDKSIKNVELTIPLVDALVLVPQHAKLMKDLVNERSKEVEQLMVLTHEASAIITKQVAPKKLEDPGSFTIPCAIGSLTFQNCLCDLGASGSLMPLSVAKRLGVTRYKESNMRLILADRSVRTPIGLIEDFPVSVQGYTVPTDFIVLDMDEEPQDPIIFGRPFLATAGAIIDVKRGKIDLHLSSDEILEFDINRSMKKPRIDGQCFYLQEMEEKVETPKDDNEESLFEIEHLLYGSQHELMGDSKVEVEKKSEVEAPRVEFMGGYSIMQEVSPPKASIKKKKASEVKALGYGNDETKIKKKKTNGNNPTTLAPSPNSMILKPWKYEDGAIEYKVKCKGRARPFAKVRAILPTELKEKGQEAIQELMGRMIVPKLEEPPWSAHTPPSTTD